jgi:cysteinyl-tRNA synthetase
MGLLTDELGDWNWRAHVVSASGRASMKLTASAVAVSMFNGMEEIAEDLRQAREEAKLTKDFSRVDKIKAALTSAGVEVRMTKDGIDLVPGPNFDPTKLEALR